MKHQESDKPAHSPDLKLNADDASLNESGHRVHHSQTGQQVYETGAGSDKIMQGDVVQTSGNAPGPTEVKNVVYVNGQLVELEKGAGSITGKELKQLAIDQGAMYVQPDYSLREEVHGQRAKDIGDDDSIEINNEPGRQPQRFTAQ